MISSTEISWSPIASGVLQGSVQDAVFFNLLVNDLNEGTECAFSNFETTKLRGVADTPEGYAAIQRYLDRLENWAERNFMKYTKASTECCTYGRMHQYRLRVNILYGKGCGNPGVQQVNNDPDKTLGFLTKRGVC